MLVQIFARCPVLENKKSRQQRRGFGIPQAILGKFDVLSCHAGHHRPPKLFLYFRHEKKERIILTKQNFPYLPNFALNKTAAVVELRRPCNPPHSRTSANHYRATLRDAAVSKQLPATAKMIEDVLYDCRSKSRLSVTYESILRTSTIEIVLITY